MRNDIPPACECDNTHENNDTVCRWCCHYGRRHWNDPDVDERKVLTTTPHPCYTIYTGHRPRGSLAPLKRGVWGVDPFSY